MLYHEYYTWQCFIDDHVIGHSDGSASLAFQWSGLDHFLFNSENYDQSLRDRLDFLKRLSVHSHLTIENHWFRVKDDSLIAAYLAHGKTAIRRSPLSDAVRNSMADHYRSKAMSNKVYTVFTLAPQTGKGSSFTKLFGSKSKKVVSVWRDLAEQLHQLSIEFKSDFPGFKLLDKSFFDLIGGSYHTDFNRKYPIDEHYDLSEQVVTEKPKPVEDCLLQGDQYQSLALIQNNPDLEPSWMLNFASTGCMVHISQILQGKDTSKVLNKSAEQSDSDSLSTRKKDRDTVALGISDAGDYRAYITTNGLCAYDNTWIIRFISTDIEQVREQNREFCKFVGSNGGLARNQAELQMHLYRVIQPGLGHLSQFKREDHSASIACMLPITTFTQGSAVPESIRMSSSFQMVGYSPSQLEIGHEFVVAKTGGGKDTHNGTEICETYPFGLDHYICEFGDSYRWIVEGFGGTYTTIDPDEIIINPLPAFTDAKDGLLPSQISLGTVEGLSIILLDESRDMSQAEIAASEKALNALYLVNGESVAPTLPDLLESLEKTDFTNEVQSAAAKVMHNNLYNFLDSSNGRAFQGQDNLILSDGITGIDLIKIDKKMLKFYLTFVSLRFAQKAFFNLDNPAKIWMNELHEPIAAAPEVVTRLIRVINRMGRKEGSFMGLITQGMNEIHAIDSEIVSSSPIRTLLVRTDSWQEIGELLDMPQRAIDIWRTYNQDTDGLPYRQCMRKIYGQWHDLFLTFPQLLLDITSTSRNDRKLKHAIGAKHDDIFERLKAFRTQKEA